MTDWLIDKDENDECQVEFTEGTNCAPGQIILPKALAARYSEDISFFFEILIFTIFLFFNLGKSVIFLTLNLKRNFS